VTPAPRGGPAPAGDPAIARRVLSEWTPPSAEQRRTRDRIVAFLDEHPRDALLRSCEPGHLTASAIVLDATGTKVLLTHHRKLGRWLQLGGHCDGDADLARVALREAEEESGIEGLVIDPVPIDVDIHVIPARKGEPEHLHLDTRFLARAPEGARERASDESLELRWFDAREARAIETDDSVRRLLRIALEG
jgi:8-oxo-dGTP pyrophosphatase MutT (NUDIX family)